MGVAGGGRTDRVTQVDMAVVKTQMNLIKWLSAASATTGLAVVATIVIAVLQRLLVH